MIKQMRPAWRTLPILADSVDEDDVVGLADGDFGGVRWERHAVDNVALFSILTKDYNKDYYKQKTCRNVKPAQHILLY